MGLMFARRRADAAKQIKANKAKAHAENQKKAWAANGKPEESNTPAEPALVQNQAQPQVKNGPLKPAAK